eukprot:6471775-Amphidinium_carterae.1
MSCPHSPCSVPLLRIFDWCSEDMWRATGAVMRHLRAEFPGGPPPDGGPSEAGVTCFNVAVSPMLWLLVCQEPLL